MPFLQIKKFLGHYCPAYNYVQNPLVYLVQSKVNCQNAKHLGVYWQDLLIIRPASI